MADGYAALTERERQTLRLIVRGHDAKSIARHLDLSVHTINERLREARRKMAVSSSREAARLLLEREGDSPDNVADKQIGGDDGPALNEPGDRGRTHRAAWIVTGVVIMIFMLGMLALASQPQVGGPVAPTASVVPAPIAESDAVQSARAWLVLGDEGRWQDGWAGTTESFRKMNTAETWAKVSTQVRVPLGKLVSRTALSQESVPAPPAGVEVVKFRSSFANKASVIETVSLAREGGNWRVVGVYLD